MSEQRRDDGSSVWQRQVYEVDPLSFVRLLRIDGEILSVQSDPVTGYVQIVTTGAGGFVVVGQQVEPLRLRIEQTSTDGGPPIVTRQEWVR